MSILYMHTLDGQPASFYPRDGVCFTSKRIRLATSLRQIRREQAECRKLCAGKWGIGEWRYGYVTIATRRKADREGA